MAEYTAEEKEIVDEFSRKYPPIPSNADEAVRDAQKVFDDFQDELDATPAFSDAQGAALRSRDKALAALLRAKAYRAIVSNTYRERVKQMSGKPSKETIKQQSLRQQYMGDPTDFITIAKTLLAESNAQPMGPGEYRQTDTTSAALALATTNPKPPETTFGGASTMEPATTRAAVGQTRQPATTAPATETTTPAPASAARFRQADVAAGQPSAATMAQTRAGVAKIRAKKQTTGAEIAAEGIVPSSAVTDTTTKPKIQRVEASPEVIGEFLGRVNSQFGTSFTTINEYLNAKGVKGMAPKAQRLERFNQFATSKLPGGITQNVRDIIQREFGWASAYIGIDPQIDQALAQLARQEIAPERFDAIVRSSAWWASRTEASRAWDLKERTPGSNAEKEIGDRVQLMRDYALSQFGVSLTPEQLRPWARQTLREGASQTTVENGVAAIIVKGDAPGAIDQLRAGGVGQRLRAINAKYGYDTSPQYLEQSISNVALGTMTEEMYENEIRTQVKALYSEDVGKLLDQGYSLDAIASPYLQIAANTLELDPASVSLSDPKFKAPLDYVDDKGVKRRMTLTEWEKKLRTDQAYGWNRTQSALTLAQEVADSIVRTFGKVQ